MEAHGKQIGLAFRAIPCPPKQVNPDEAMQQVYTSPSSLILGKIVAPAGCDENGFLVGIFCILHLLTMASNRSSVVPSEIDRQQVATPSQKGPSPWP